MRCLPTCQGKESCDPWRAAPGEVGREAAGDDEAGAAFRALGEEGRHLLEAVRRFLQAGVHGAHQRAVAQGGEAEVEGGEEVRVGFFHACQHLVDLLVGGVPEIADRAVEAARQFVTGTGLFEQGYQQGMIERHGATILCN
jgi:hypothetical protein